MQRMLLIEAFFGGARLSEMLHHWRCDVLPGRYRPMLFPDDRASQLPLIVLAHPSQSTYTGAFGAGEDRTQHLAHYYSLLPRLDLEGTSSDSGWKGMAFDNPDRMLSQIFWCNQSYAKMYIELFGYVQTNLYTKVSPEVLASHPYLYINDDVSRPEFGQPLKMSNARKVFTRAITRITDVGLGYRMGAHGARHFYKAALEKLLENEDDIAKCMHHKSVISQRQYAESSLRARTRLNDALARAL